MKYLTLSILAIMLSACNSSGGGESADATTTPIVAGPFDPAKDYAEITGTWFFIVNPHINARYNSVLNRVYVCDEAFCRNNDSRSESVGPGQCTYSASATLGTYEICYTTISDELTMMNSVWVSITTL